MSLGNEFIGGMSYRFRYDKGGLKKGNNLWWESWFSWGGNVSWLVYGGFGKGLKERDKKLLKSGYGELVKMRWEVGCLFKVGEKEDIGSGLMGGILYGYGKESVGG